VKDKYSLKKRFSLNKSAKPGKVSIIGHSLGGSYARELAWKFPDLVECAILLGSPVKDPLESSNTFLRPIFEAGAQAMC
jgi:pimeloyl-ACP methyl ester carboxylesterase